MRLQGSAMATWDSKLEVYIKDFSTPFLEQDRATGHGFLGVSFDPTTTSSKCKYLWLF